MTMYIYIYRCISIESMVYCNPRSRSFWISQFRGQWEEWRRPFILFAVFHPTWVQELAASSHKIVNPPIPQKQHRFETTHCYGQLVCFPNSNTHLAHLWCGKHSGIHKKSHIWIFLVLCHLIVNVRLLNLSACGLYHVVSIYFVGYVSVVSHIQGCSRHPRYKSDLVERQSMSCCSLLVAIVYL